MSTRYETKEFSQNQNGFKNRAIIAVVKIKRFWIYKRYYFLTGVITCMNVQNAGATGRSTLVTYGLDQPLGNRAKEL